MFPAWNILFCGSDSCTALYEDLLIETKQLILTAHCERTCRENMLMVLSAISSLVLQAFNKLVKILNLNENSYFNIIQLQ